MLLSTTGKVLNGVLLERMNETVDPKLRDQQAGFWRNKSCADQIASLSIIMEQSLEWNPSLYSTCRQRDNVEATETLWSPREYNLPHPVHLSGHELQDWLCRPAVSKFCGEAWSSAGVPAFTVPLPPGHRLDHGDHHNRQEQRYTVDTLDTARRPRFHWWLGTPVT